MTSSEPEPTPGGDTPPERLLHCSAERTLLVRRSADGREELVKVFERGSPADAQREADLGRELALPGLVRYRSAGLDPATGRPCLVMDYHQGRDLEVVVGEQGPFPPRDAARIAHLLAATLDSLHHCTTPSAPLGLAHGDVKPGNVLLLDGEPPRVLVLDLEHVVALQPEDSRDGVEAGRFTGGTHGFAPPEAYLGVRPNVAFESFAFGATLHFLLTGQLPFQGPDPRSIAAAVQTGLRPDWLLAGLPRELSDLVRACLAVSPAARPTMGQATQALEAFLHQQSQEDRILDVVFRHVQTAQLEEARSQLEKVGNSKPRFHELEHLLRRRAGLLRRQPGPPARVQSEDLLHRAVSLVTGIPKLSAWLKRFPAHAEALACRLDYRAQAAELVLRVPPEIARCKREVRFAEGEELLNTAVQAVRMALGLPGPLTVGEDLSARLPGPMARDPLRFLQLAQEDLLGAAETHSRLLGRLEEAEAQLNLDGAAQFIEAIAAVYGGASSVVAELKDRLHRLGFYLEEIGRPRQKLGVLEEQLGLANVDQDLTPLRDFLQLCADRAPPTEPQAARTQSGLGRLQRVLHDLCREYPHLAPRAEQAAKALDQSLEAMSDLAWGMIESARAKLAAVPIPVRPLQSILNRLDTLRLLEVLVDRPERSRAELLDEVESIRLDVQQARTTRDRIARGAEEAMARGHWTTALYDMQRAVKQLDLADSEVSPTDRDLIERLEEFKRTKQEIETTVRQNVELARRYATILDNPESTSEDRLQLLRERRECLQLLVEVLKGERANPYVHDLRDVDVHIAQERSDQAELLLDETTEIGERLRIATTTLQTLERSAPGQESVGRIQRLITHWQRQRDRARQEVGKSEVLAQAIRSRRRRILWMCVGGVAVSAAVAFLAWQLLG